MSNTIPDSGCKVSDMPTAGKAKHKEAEKTNKEAVNSLSLKQVKGQCLAGKIGDGLETFIKLPTLTL